MKTAVHVFSAVLFSVLLCASSGAQEIDQLPAAGAEAPGTVPTKRALRPIPGYPQGGGLPSSGAYGGSSGVYPPHSSPGYPESRSYYEYSPNAERPDSYGRMRSPGGPDIDTRGDRMGADWYRNMPAPNYDSRSRRN